MNQLYATTKLGTIGELLVQLRFLEHGVQAAPPIKDSGNDLIAIRGTVIRAVQVRTTTRERIAKPRRKVLYDILVIVQLPSCGGRYAFEKGQIYLFARREVPRLSGKVTRYSDNLLSEALIDKLFTEQR